MPTFCNRLCKVLIQLNSGLYRLDCALLRTKWLSSLGLTPEETWQLALDATCPKSERGSTDFMGLAFLEGLELQRSLLGGMQCSWAGYVIYGILSCNIRCVMLSSLLNWKNVTAETHLGKSFGQGLWTHHMVRPHFTWFYGNWDKISACVLPTGSLWGLHKRKWSITCSVQRKTHSEWAFLAASSSVTLQQHLLCSSVCTHQVCTNRALIITGECLNLHLGSS